MENAVSMIDVDATRDSTGRTLLLAALVRIHIIDSFIHFTHEIICE